VRRLAEGLLVHFGRFEVTVKNNSGRFIGNLDVTIYLYDKNDLRIDDITVYFSNLNSGEDLAKTSRGANRDGRPWSRFTTRYEIDY
jgi:hypothetical protein